MATQAEEVIFKINFDTSQVETDIKNLDSKISNVGKGVNNDTFKSFKTQLREATQEALRLGDAVEKGTGSKKAYDDARANLAGLKDKYSDFQKSVEGFNPDNRLKGLVQVTQGAAVAVQGLAGAFVLVGVDADTAQVAIAKLQAIMAFTQAIGSIDDVKEGFRTLKDSVTNLTKSFTTGDWLGVALIGISAIGVAIVAMSKSTSDASIAADALASTVEGYNEALVGAITNVNNVKQAFEDFRKGVISKEQTLKIYNDTLGDSLGRTKDIAVAEKNLNDKADEYIRVTGLKAQANILMARSAKAAADILTASLDDQTSFFDKTKSTLLAYLGFTTKAVSTAIEAQRKGAEDLKKDKEQEIKVLDGLIKKLNDDIGKSGINTSVVVDEKVIAKGKDDLLDYQKFVDGVREDLYVSTLSDQERELHQLDLKYADILKKYEKNLKRQNELLELKKIEENKINQKYLNIGSDEAPKRTTGVGLDGIDSVVTDNGKPEGIDEVAVAEDKYGSLLAAEDIFYKARQQAARGNFEELEKIEATHLALSESLNLAHSLAIGEINLRTAEGYAQLGTAIGSILNQASIAAGRNTKKGKDLQVAATTISTISGGISAYMGMVSSIPGPVGIALGVVAAAAVVASGYASIKKILAVPIPDAGSGGPSVAPPTPPQINSTVLQQLPTQDVRVTNQNQTPVRAYITNGDLQSNQEKQVFLNKLSNF